MKRKFWTAVALAAAVTIAMALVGCVSQEPATEAPADATSAATGEGDWGAAGAKSDQSYQDGSGWSIALKGVREAKLWQSYYDDAKKHASHYVEKTVDKKGVPGPTFIVRT